MSTSFDWFSEARFGMFIHWGLYSLPGGRYHGKDVPWVSEWLMRKFKIPVAEYEQLAKQFNPTQFDAEDWVRRLKEAGMRYLVITAKHHDGFAMFHSLYDKYNIVDATPFGRDPMTELSAACEKYSIRLGFYYSQDQDWHEAGASGNTWDFPEEQKTPEAFQAYLDSKVKFQLKELLTRYGKISIIWFDTPHFITPEQSEDLKKYVKSFQPECLVSGRVGNGKGDYESLGDNQVPSHPVDHPVEGLGTMNESWGYKSMDTSYRSRNELLRILCAMSACGANYLLNVGPDAAGQFPEPSKKILAEIGAWLRTNGEALYGTESRGLGINGRCSWGDMTRKGDICYFWIFHIPEDGLIHFYGIRTPLAGATLMDGTAVEADEEHDPAMDYHRLRLHLKQLDDLPCVVKVRFQGPVSLNTNSYSAADF